MSSPVPYDIIGEMFIRRQSTGEMKKVADIRLSAISFHEATQVYLATVEDIATQFITQIALKYKETEVPEVVFWGHIGLRKE